MTLFHPAPFPFEKLKKTFSGKENVRFRFRPRRRTLLKLRSLFLKHSKHLGFKKIPDWNISKTSFAKIRGNTTKFLSQILSFIKNKFLPRFLAKKSREKKVREFVKTQGWKKVRGNDHEIFNHITGHDGNDYEHLEDFLIDDFKHFSLTFNDLQSHHRKKFLNFHQVLFALLKKNGFNPNEDDFKLLVLPSRRAEQEKIIQEVFKRNNWKENGS